MRAAKAAPAAADPAPNPAAPEAAVDAAVAALYGVALPGPAGVPRPKNAALS